ncbi:MAG TPA: cytochrome oxidase assembly protein [Gammaproteobacteria bacterium]|nr:cytochrome oxidase assembly protein [Gammaproteobacteria bacterium]
MQSQQDTKRRNLQAWVIFLLFFVPLATAAVLYFQTDWRPGARGNHGELVIPPVPTPAVSLPTPDGDRTEEEFLRHHWSLVYLARSPCEAQCREALYNSRQMRLALGRLLERVQRVYLYLDAPPPADFLAREHPDLLVASTAGPGAAALLETFKGQPEGFWLVDPLGNVMMRYPPDQEPRGMMEDIKRLLRLSRIG